MGGIEVFHLLFSLQAICVFNAIQHSPATYNDYRYPDAAIAAGWLIAIMPILPVPGYMVYLFAKHVKSWQVRLEAWDLSSPDTSMWSDPLGFCPLPGSFAQFRTRKVVNEHSVIQTLLIPSWDQNLSIISYTFPSLKEILSYIAYTLDVHPFWEAYCYIKNSRQDQFEH